MIKDVIVAFLVVVSIFFGIMPHRVHCDTLKMFSETCPSHRVFLLNSIILFVLAVILSQWDFIIGEVTRLCA